MEFSPADQQTEDVIEAAEATPDRGATIRARMSTADVVKFVGLVAFLALATGLVVLLWPYIGVVFQKGGVQILVDQVQAAGILGILVFFSVQLLQVIVAFIPGEVVQVAAGMVYGTVGGFLVIVLGCIASSAIVFLLVHKLGAPFVQNMVSTKYLEKFRHFEKTGKLDWVVFILFLIPGMPKDVFTYLVPLTDMPMGRFLLLSTLGRIPAMFVSCFAASSIVKGDYWTAGIIFGLAAIIAVAGILLKDKIFAFFGNRVRLPKKNS